MFLIRLFFANSFIFSSFLSSQSFPALNPVAFFLNIESDTQQIIKGRETTIVFHKLLAILKNCLVFLMQTGELSLRSRINNCILGFFTCMIVRWSLLVIKMKDLSSDCESHGRELFPIKKCIILYLSFMRVTICSYLYLQLQGLREYNAFVIISSIFGITFPYKWNKSFKDNLFSKSQHVIHTSKGITNLRPKSNFVLVCIVGSMRK